MKIIYNTITNELYKYPRADDEPVIGLSSELLVFDVIQEPVPALGEGFSYRQADPVIDVDNQTVTYGWIVEEVISESEPNYLQFLNEVIISQVYQKAIMQAISNPVVNVGFTTTMGALILAAGGNPNQDGIAASFTMMLSQMVLDPEDLEELLSVAQNSNIPLDFIHNIIESRQ
ncbi:hypothetical protein SCRM01_025 [Synechococcus phage S-CRM01]|uniref:hypothetical protein n=1 Tax=Synechococcus phage S-CRM01 TaxID=1026955 RepID=UPI000209E343|nr:hypothetical protein SCRM01_025 [Synechococcus phage S-CRM01]AEC52972.1 hypothetical protein SCRM01_025 [Synechococcus phage S-CRM01]